MSNVLSPPRENTIILNVMPSYGMQLIGAMVSAALWGIACAQMFTYFLKYPKDHWTLKAFVLYLWTLDTVVEAMTLAGIFPPLITKWGSVSELETVKPIILHRTWLATVLAFSVQMFLLNRIHKFAGRTGQILCICIAAAVAVALCQIAAVVVYSVWVLSENLSVDATLARRRNAFVAGTARALTAFTDILITVWMTILLSTKARSPFKRTNRLIFRVIFMTINTGMWTSVVALIDFVLLTWRSTDFTFSLCEYPLSSLYLNMCLVNLNVRQFLGADLADPTLSALGFPSNHTSGYESVFVGGLPSVLGNEAVSHTSTLNGRSSTKDSMAVPIDTLAAA